MRPGEILPLDRDIVLNEGKETRELMVANMGDRPVQVGSHFHFFEVNRCLEFNRREAFGFRLDIPSGTSVRFEPGEKRSVRLVALGGKKIVYGCNDLTVGEAVPENLDQALERAKAKKMRGV
ncbi:urease subunit beta [Brotaphodocola sp.]|uniref:urease subunit beta n=1 Tax=Brotaphodocola sp. TaxID=3073577 RepID=UPI003D7C819B